MNTRYIYAIIGAVLFLVVGIWWVQANKVSDAPAGVAATSTDSTLSNDSGQADSPQAATSSGSELTPSPVVAQKPEPATTPKTTYQFSLVPGEAVASWDFAGTHKDGGTLEAKVRADITRLKGLINSGTYTNYELYVSIANQYEMLGDGKQEFTYLNYALAIDSTKTGLAWHNMGKLLERLGAYKSARVAYDRMIQAQSTSQYIRARLEFLQAHMPEDTAAIAQAQADLAASTW
ncbi:MAG: hypothetical protein Q7R90_03610 [bacterium]|nr:hypothetical protein [bacterium]